MHERDRLPNTGSIRAATLDRSVDDIVDDIEGVYLRHLPPFTALLVRTMNSVYRVVITRGPEVYVQGGAYFPDPTSAYLDGAIITGQCLKVGWIGVGLMVQIRSGGRSIITSRVCAITVCAITAEPPSAHRGGQP